MANIRLGGGVTDIRGSIGGTVFSRGAAGAYARQRVKCINPRSSLQDARRARFSFLVQAWSQTLTLGNRQGWEAYALETPFLNKVGDAVHISGMACFIRSNSLYMQMGQGMRNTAPDFPGHSATIVATVVADKSDGEIQVNEPTAGFDKTAEADWLAVFAGLPMSPGRTLSPRGYRYLGRIQGATVPPTFPVKFTWPYPASLGMNYPVSISHLDFYFRMGTPLELMPVVQA